MDKAWLKFQEALSAAGYDGSLGFWFEQYCEFLSGNRSSDMHDFTLVWMSDNA